MSWRDALSESWLGRFIRGFVKIGSAAALAALLSSINMDLSSVDIGGVTVNLSFVWDLIRVFAPLLLIISGLRDMGVGI